MAHDGDGFEGPRGLLKFTLSRIIDLSVYLSPAVRRGYKMLFGHMRYKIDVVKSSVSLPLLILIFVLDSGRPFGC